MRHALALAICFAASTSTVSAAPTVITIGNDALPATVTAAHHGVGLIGDAPGASVVEVDDADLPAISEEMHHTFHRCGGMIESPSLEEALHPIQLRSTPVDYTLDRAPAVMAVLPQVHATTIAQTIRELSAMPNRYYKSAAGAEASNWLAERWRSFATRPGVTVQLVDHGFPQKGVVLTIPGTTRADEVIVIGGHLDSIAMGGLSANAPGADDDASGIATLTEIARALLASDYRPERTIKLVAYEAEEVGLLGSQALVRDFKRANTNVVGALQLDMTNYHGSTKDIWLMKDFTSAAQNAFLVKLIETYTGATWGVDACGYACSDHASWTRAGVPASMPFESRMHDRNKHIHSAKDTLAQSNGEATHALAFARLGVAYAIELGKGELGNEKAEHDFSSLWQLLALGLLGAAGLAARRVN